MSHQAKKKKTQTITASIPSRKRRVKKKFSNTPNVLSRKQKS